MAEWMWFSSSAKSENRSEVRGAVGAVGEGVTHLSSEAVAGKVRLVLNASDLLSRRPPRSQSGPQWRTPSFIWASCLSHLCLAG